jgi:nicotinamidase-related amidase
MSRFSPFVAFTIIACLAGNAAAEPIKLVQRSRAPDSKGKGELVRLEHMAWDTEHTAVIVCDMWDSHHSLNAVKRVQEIAPRMNQVLEKARSMGMLIIHAPSSCMEPYKDHPARKRAQAAPTAKNLPKDIGTWCYWIPSEEKDKYPIDQTDGGDDTSGAPQQAWQAKLKAIGRKPGAPWLSQIDVLKIHDNDAISDSGVEIWNLLEQRGIQNVMLVGVHTNMCVLGRPFGLRQMAKNKKNVVLVRDMTDTMYNPKSWPYVSHFQGTDLIVQHIERYVCATITSDQLVGGQPFKFKDDVRKTAAVIVGENEYKTSETLPLFARRVLGEQLGLDVRLAVETDASKPIKGFADAVGKADILVLSARRRGLPAEDMALLKKKLETGTPLLALRTASHSFDAKGKAPSGFVEWPEFDLQVIGGNYHNHHKVGPLTTVTVATAEKVVPKDERHPILTGLKTPFTSKTSLYRNTPLQSAARPLLIGTIPGETPEPVAWTHQYKKARVVYTSLGAPEDFDNPEFVRLLHNGARWLLDMKIADAPPKKVRGDF